jgi:hypothetical protein
MKVYFWTIVYSFYKPKTREGRGLKLVRLGLVDAFFIYY